MARYHLDWTMVEARMPNDPKQIAAGWKGLIGLVRQDFDKGLLKDWGAFPGDRAGYAVMEGTELDLMRFTMQYAPYVAFHTRPVASVGQVEEFLVAASGGR